MDMTRSVFVLQFLPGTSIKHQLLVWGTTLSLSVYYSLKKKCGGEHCAW